MSKPGLVFLSLSVGLVVGLLLGYLVFRPGTPASPAATVQTPDTSGARVYFYLVNDSTLSRHTVSGSGTGVVHTVDTIGVSWR